MPNEPSELYAICSASSLAPGEAMTFELARVGEDGESKPLPLIIVRRDIQNYYAYVNSCPHEGAKLNSGPGDLIDPEDNDLICGIHGARFQVDTGRCSDGPCRNKSLEPITVVIDDGDVCITGVTLVEEEWDGKAGATGASLRPPAPSA
jgi:nitrite reductase/ring-hydroxylating ferredoxin subunit